MGPSDNRSCPILNQALYRRHSKCLKLLIVEGADVNQKIDGDETVLMKAMEGCSTEDIRFLISAGADVNATRPFGLTVLMIATKKSRDDVVRMLIDAGADVNAADSGGVTALLHAAKHGLESSLMVLVEAWARLNVKSLFGETPLNMMVKLSQHACVKYLVEKGAYVNYIPYRTALYYGVMVSNVNSIRLLLGPGADVNIPDDKGITPLMLASRRELYRLLLRETNDTTITLMSICRRAIRKYLLGMARRQTNLYVQVTKLGLPTSIADYLLYKNDDQE